MLANDLKAQQMGHLYFEPMQVIMYWTDAKCAISCRLLAQQREQEALQAQQQAQNEDSEEEEEVSSSTCMININVSIKQYHSILCTVPACKHRGVACTNRIYERPMEPGADVCPTVGLIFSITRSKAFCPHASSMLVLLPELMEFYVG